MITIYVIKLENMKIEIVQIDEFGNSQATYNFHRSPFDFGSCGQIGEIVMLVISMVYF